MPSISCCAKNVTRSTIKVVKSRVFDRKPLLVPHTKFEERLNICKSCEYLVNGICQECGCVMQIKAFLTAMECPLEEPKWKSE